MGRRLVAALIAATVLLLVPAGAEEKAGKKTEPVVYFFWSAGCRYSRAARAFLQAAQAKDAALRVRDFEIDQSIPNGRLLERFYGKIGLPPVVPTIVIGHHVIIGYIDDDSTGAEILSTVEDCRKTTCKDAVHDLIEAQDHLEAAVTPPRRPVCDKLPGRAAFP